MTSHLVQRVQPLPMVSLTTASTTALENQRGNGAHFYHVSTKQKITLYGAVWHRVLV
jgi:hypothetical protein